MRWRLPFFCVHWHQATPPRYVTKFSLLKPGILRNASLIAIRPIFLARRTADCRDLAWRSALSRPPHAKVDAANLSRVFLPVVDADTGRNPDETAAPSVTGASFSPHQPGNRKIRRPQSERARSALSTPSASVACQMQGTRRSHTRSFPPR